MHTPFRILLVDDNPDDRALAAREIRKVLEPVEIAEAGSAEELERRLSPPDWDAVVTDYLLRWSTGTEVLRRCKALRPAMPVIMFTASGSEEVAVEAMKQGLDDYITKTPKHYGRIPFAVKNAVDRARQREAAEAAMRARDEADRRLQLAFDAAGVGTWEFWPATGELRYSEQLGPMFGRARGFAHATLDEWLADIHPDDRPTVQRRFAQALQREAPFNAEFRTLGPDGAGRWIASRGLVHHPAGLKASVLGIAIDITARKRLEEDLRRADRQKDEFLAMLAHELRNPLAPLSNAHALLVRTAALGEREQRLLALAQRQTRQLARLVDDLLEVSRITTGKISLKKEPVLVSTIVYNAVESVHGLFEQRGQTLHVKVPDEPVRVVVDAARMSQVLENLLTNAAKYTPDGGHVRVTAELAANTVLVCVDDDGVGIAPELLPHLFSLFTQAERSIDRAQGGLGVGLALVKRLVELHGGTVEAASEGAGRGARFTVRIPQSAAQEAPEPAPDAPGVPGVRSALRVLLVDDNRDAAATLELLLQEEGHTVTVAHDGHAGLAAARSVRPDVAILDIGLPGMDGYALARAVREAPECRHTVLVALSGYGQPADRQRSRQAGFAHHLVKPATAEQINAVLAALAQPAP